VTDATSHLERAPLGPDPVDLPPSQFHVDVQPHRDVVHLVPVGELDLATADQLRGQLDELINAGCRRLIVDLRELKFIDSTGLALLARYYRTAQDDGWQLSIIQGPPQIRRMFELSGLLDRLPFAQFPPKACA
jgi:anti-sigma B factor antagonist